MKRKMKIGIVSDYSPVPEEYRMFQSQPEQVLACYSLARHCMAVIMPLSALAAVYSPLLALGLSFAGGAAGFLLLRKRYRVKGALVPFLCSLAGIPIGLYILSPLLSHALALKEAFRGI
ncbi:MAG: hypothetical protein LBB78_07075 [Spirochaetaceae bacterium]|jgi:hypothetical protein|nr:hypothetical protein [Spirochaetaceae bacterium]